LQTPEQEVQGTQALSRALAVLAAVRRGCNDLASIGREVGTSKSTTHRLVAFLQRSGFLRHMEGRGYLLGAKLIELGSAALEQMPLTGLARPHIERLAQQTGDTIHLSVRDGDNIIYVDKISSNKGLEMRSRIGMHKPMATTGTGKAMMLDSEESEWARLYSLAHIDVIAAEVPPPGFLAWDDYRQAMRGFKAQGYAFEMEENEAGIRCVAAPIRDARGAIVAGLSVASTVPYMSKERMQTLAPAVVACARTIAGELGYSGAMP
jgi:DNA-binding IclR family transcriptional regulator